MSLEKLPPVAFKNTIEKLEIGQRMYHHRKRLYDLAAKKSKQGQSQTNMTSYKTLFEENPKKNSIIEGKYTEIERENRILFEKLNRINKKKRKSEGMDRSRSLNVTVRKKQIEEIQNQNVKMFGRILRQKPFMSFKQSDKEFMKTKRISDRISQKSKFMLEDWY